MNDLLRLHHQPDVAVGLLERSQSATILLEGQYTIASGQSIGPGQLHAQCKAGILQTTGVLVSETSSLELTPRDPKMCQFSLEATIGIDFHWEKQEVQTFLGRLCLLAEPADRVTVVNRVPLESYLTSVICSEMNAASPVELIKTHAIISRSWLVAQLDARDAPQPQRYVESSAEGEIMRWTDREAHARFDVCADDHCQRYQGSGRVNVPHVAAMAAETRGQILTYGGRPCDARFSKCCGGVVEEFQTAWGDIEIPYLVALWDGPDAGAPLPLFSEERTFRQFLEEPPVAYCDCHDATILDKVLNDYDRLTDQFFRWEVRLEAEEVRGLIANKLGVDLGRVRSLDALERGPSGRLKRMRVTGEAGILVIGKELEIRRALSPSHLYSSAFAVDTEGPPERPTAFVLTGAGWGHGVGLCQIGAAVMASRGFPYEEILKHYYPGTVIERIYR